MLNFTTYTTLEVDLFSRGHRLFYILKFSVPKTFLDWTWTL